MVSILILTLNEEQNLPGCLESVAWSDDIVVFDSFSSDLTTSVATNAGARVVQRKFDNWAAHQNWAHENIQFKNKWVFYLDADERMTPELKAEIQEIANNSEENRVAFYCGRKNYFMGKWIKHAYPPSMIMRFFIPSTVRFERLVNPTPVIDGSHGYLSNMFVHFNFSKGLTEWFDKHNRYSYMEAKEAMKVMGEAGFKFGELFSKDNFTRRKALKRLSFSFPLRPLLRFIYSYVFKLGFLDGTAGFQYCCMISIYEFMIDLKILELKRREKHLPV